MLLAIAPCSVVDKYVVVRVFFLIFWNWVIKAYDRCWHEIKAETTKPWSCGGTVFCHVLEEVEKAGRLGGRVS